MALVATASAAVLVSACAPSRQTLFDPVARDVERRVGAPLRWHTATANGALAPGVVKMLAHPLERDGAVRIALARSRHLQAALEDLGVAGADLAEATVLPPTEVDFDYKLGVTGGHHEAELSVVQDVLDLLQIGQRRGAAQSELAAARARAVAATVSLVAEVETSFYATVAARQDLELAQSALDAEDAAADLARRVHDAGSMSDLDFARADERRAQAELDRDRAATALATAQDALARHLDLPTDAPAWQVAPRLADLPAEPPALADLEAVALDQSLALAALRHEAAAAESRGDYAAVRAWLPGLGVGAAVSKRDDEPWEVGPAVRIGLPIFDHQEGPRMRAEAEQRRAESQLAATTADLGAAARSTATRASAAYAEAKRLHDVVLPLRQTILDELVLHYNAMDASTFELVAAKRALVAAGHQYVAALERYWSTMSAVDALRRGVAPEFVTFADPASRPTSPTLSEDH